MDFDELDREWRMYLTRDMVSVGDVLAGVGVELAGSRRFYEVLKVSGSELRMKALEAVAGGPSHPGWGVVPRYPMAFVTRKSVDGVDRVDEVDPMMRSGEAVSVAEVVANTEAAIEQAAGLCAYCGKADTGCQLRTASETTACSEFVQI